MKETRNRYAEDQLRLGNKTEFKKTLRRAKGLEIEKQIARSPVPLQRSKHWTLLRDRRPPKRKEKREAEEEPVI
jgi:hypothetical protein